MGMHLPKPLEKDIQGQILDYLHLRRVFAWRQNAGAMKGEHKGKRWFVRFASVDGISDIVGVLPGGRFLAIEVKRPGEEPTPSQRAFLSRVTDAGGMAFAATSVREVQERVDHLL